MSIFKEYTEEDFEQYTIKEFNMVTGTKLKPNMNFGEVNDEIDDKEVSFFYISMDPDDVLEAIENEPEVADALDIRLVNINELDIYIAIY